MKTRIYLDNAATTKTSQEVVDAMLPYFTENYGNASSIYEVGQRSKEAITTAREDIAKVLGAKTEEIYFTAGGSEADNWALKAAFEAYSKRAITLSQQRLNTMRFYTPVNIWRKRALKSHI